MRLTTDVAALALGISRKTLDNLLTREARPIVGAGRRGRSRRLVARELELIAIALLLNRDLGVSLARGLELAHELARDPVGETTIGSLGRLRFDVKALRTVLHAALADAIEEVVPPRRGRPRADRHATRGAS